MKQFIAIFAFLLILLSCDRSTNISSETFNPEWHESFPGIWETTINQPDDFNLLSVANKVPRSETLNTKTPVSFPISKNETSM